MQSYLHQSIYSTHTSEQHRKTTNPLQNETLTPFPVMFAWQYRLVLEHQNDALTHEDVYTNWTLHTIE